MSAGSSPGATSRGRPLDCSSRGGLLSVTDSRSGIRDAGDLTGNGEMRATRCLSRCLSGHGSRLGPPVDASHAIRCRHRLGTDRYRLPQFAIRSYRKIICGSMHRLALQRVAPRVSGRHSPPLGPTLNESLPGAFAVDDFARGRYDGARGIRGATSGIINNADDPVRPDDCRSSCPRGPRDHTVSGSRVQRLVANSFRVEPIDGNGDLG